MLDICEKDFFMRKRTLNVRAQIKKCFLRIGDVLDKVSIVCRGSFCISSHSHKDTSHSYPHVPNLKGH